MTKLEFVRIFLRADGGKPESLKKPSKRKDQQAASLLAYDGESEHRTPDYSGERQRIISAGPPYFPSLMIIIILGYFFKVKCNFFQTSLRISSNRWLYPILQLPNLEADPLCGRFRSFCHGLRRNFHSLHHLLHYRRNFGNQET